MSAIKPTKGDPCCSKCGTHDVEPFSDPDMWRCLVNGHVFKYQRDSALRSCGRFLRLRVTAVYANGAERELFPFSVTEDGLTGFEIDGEQYVAFIARIPNEEAPAETIEFVDERLPF